MNEEKYITAVMEGALLSGGNYTLLSRNLLSSVYQKDLQIKALQDKVKEMDEVISDSRGDITVRCRSCQEYYELPCDLSEFNPDFSYCGKNEFCCP